MSYTSIQITHSTRQKLSELKSGHQTYDEVLTALMDLIPSSDSEGNYTPEFRLSLLRGLADIKSGRTYSLNQLKSVLGVK